jgi:hypothetical protein
MNKRFKVGDKVKLTDDACQNECYTNYVGKTLIISFVSTSRIDHPGFDSSSRSALYDCVNCNLSFYDWELQKV